MVQYFWRKIITVCIICFLLISCYYTIPYQNLREYVYLSDLKIINSGDINGGIGLDKPYWTDKLVICGKYYRKGLVVHPKDGGRIAFVEFLLPKIGGHLRGLAGCAEETDGTYKHKMRFRIFVDGDLLYERELNGEECIKLNLDIGFGRVLRIETDDGFDGNYYDHMAFGNLRIVY